MILEVMMDKPYNLPATANERILSGTTKAQRTFSATSRADWEASCILKTMSAAMAQARQIPNLQAPAPVRKMLIGKMRGGKVLHDAQVLGRVLRTLKDLNVWVCVHNLGGLEYDLYLLEGFSKRVNPDPERVLIPANQKPTNFEDNL
jgi:hypothetical protein